MADALRPGETRHSDPFPPISRLTLALYCGASGDHNPLHVDTDFAREAGLDDVIAHGMLPMAYLGRFVTGLYPQATLARLSTRFVAMTHVGDRLTCIAEHAGSVEDGPSTRIALSVVDQSGQTKLVGEAEVRRAA